MQAVEAVEEAVGGQTVLLPAVPTSISAAAWRQMAVVTCSTAANVTRLLFAVGAPRRVHVDMHRLRVS